MRIGYVIQIARGIGRIKMTGGRHDLMLHRLKAKNRFKTAGGGDQMTAVGFGA